MIPKLRRLVNRKDQESRRGPHIKATINNKERHNLRKLYTSLLLRIYDDIFQSLIQYLRLFTRKAFFYLQTPLQLFWTK